VVGYFHVSSPLLWAMYEKRVVVFESGIDANGGFCG